MIPRPDPARTSVGACLRAIPPAALLLALSACTHTAPPPPAAAPATVPPEFIPACGHPGTVVSIRSTQGRVDHAKCDLTGVSLRSGTLVVPVPARGAGTGVESFTVINDLATGDVIFRADPEKD